MRRINTCEHDDCIVIYDGLGCPLCGADEEIEDLKNQIDELEE